MNTKKLEGLDSAEGLLAYLAGYGKIFGHAIEYFDKNMKH